VSWQWDDGTTLKNEAGTIGKDDTLTVEELKRLNKSRKHKTVSNEERESPANPHSRITKMTLALSTDRQTRVADGSQERMTQILLVDQPHPRFVRDTLQPCLSEPAP
jgi:hypothetical protein